MALAGEEDLARVRIEIDRLGRNEESLAKWLESPRFPLGGRTQIRTLADANRVWWALKAMLKRGKEVASSLGNLARTCVRVYLDAQ